MLTVLFILSTILQISLAEPTCQIPLPLPASIPNLSDCHSLVFYIFAISLLQHDEPILWSRNPTSFPWHRKLPYHFRDPLPSNDCEFVVDALYERSEDIFPTKLIGEAAEDVVEKCLEQGIDGAETLGAVAVGPGHVITVMLKKKGWLRGSGGGALVALNVTNVALLRLGNSSELAPSTIEDG